MYYTYTASPVGELLLAGTENDLKVIGFPDGAKATDPAPGWQQCEAPFAEAARQLAEYFAGQRRVFDLPLAPEVTAFQAAVLAALAGIPYGETRTYGEIASAIGKPKAVRAVGAANGRNPLPIVVPCHRVIGKDGGLTGFGGGLPTKRYLLELEQRNM